MGLQPTRPQPPAQTPPPAATGAEVSSAAIWGLSGLLLAGGGIVFVAVAAGIGEGWAAAAGIACGLVALAMGSQARSIATRAAVLEPGMGRMKRARAKRRAYREHAPVAAAANFLGSVAMLAGFGWFLAQ